jgi:thiol-disulfide isomerase/thioredoxin
MADGMKGAYPAPPFQEGLDWINTGGKALTLADLRGKVLLLDFWTYGCINCMHIIPVVRQLEEKYANELIVVGVHSGKYIEERVTENIRTATWRLGVEHPVVNDRHFRTWRSYNVQAWPTVVLVSPDGRYIGQHSGEFTFEDFDKVIGAAVDTYSKAGMMSAEPLHFPLDPEPTPASRDGLHFPGKVLADPVHGRLFISDTANHRVLVTNLSQDGASASVVSIIGNGTAGFKDGAFGDAMLNHPEGLALQENTLFIADKDNHSIRAANLASGTLETIAGTGTIGHRGEGGIGRDVSLNSPWDVLESDNYLYIAMAGTHQIWRLILSTGRVEPFIGSGRENLDDGPHKSATLAQPSGLTTDEQRLFFADAESSAVRASDFSPDGYTQTLVGAGLFDFGDRDGSGLEARLQHCLGVAYHDGALYVADAYNCKIKLVDLATKTCVTVLGSGEPGDLYEPGGLSVWEGQDGANARLYIADTNNHRLLKSVIDDAGTLLPAIPVTLTFASGAATKFTDKDD